MSSKCIFFTKDVLYMCSLMSKVRVKAFLLRKGHIHHDVFKFTLREHLSDCFGFILE